MNTISFLFVRGSDDTGPARGNREEEGVARRGIAAKYYINSFRAWRAPGASKTGAEHQRFVIPDES
jgi:hypothetical protein